MTDELSEIAARPARYENVDGTVEMGFGLMALSMALLVYVTPLADKAGILPRGVTGLLLLMYSIYGLFAAIGFFVTKAIKKHITHPRTGYVAYRRITRGNTWKAVFFAIGCAAFAAALAFLISRAHGNREPHWLRVLMVFGFVGPYAFLVFHTAKEHPWKKSVVLAMAIGLLAIVFVVPGGTNELSGPVLLFTAVTWLGSGIATLLLYIRHTRPHLVDEE